jgi:AraC family transcriptional regulator
MASEILIKGMVCERCISVIKGGVSALGYAINNVSLGKLTFAKSHDKEGLDKIESFLVQNGFEMISNRQARVVSQVKEIINEVFRENIKHHSRLKFSALLSDNLHMNYDSISELFTEVEGITLEKFIITKRLEKVKELLVYTDFTLTEIAYITGFSSINHLSRQFKEITGLSPSHFKSIRASKQKLSGKHEENL